MSSTGATQDRDLAADAVWLAGVVATSLPREAEAWGLAALLTLQHARSRGPVRRARRPGPAPRPGPLPLGRRRDRRGRAAARAGSRPEGAGPLPAAGRHRGRARDRAVVGGDRLAPDRHALRAAPRASTPRRSPGSTAPSPWRSSGRGRPRPPWPTSRRWPGRWRRTTSSTPPAPSCSPRSAVTTRRRRPTGRALSLTANDAERRLLTTRLHSPAARRRLLGTRLPDDPRGRRRILLEQERLAGSGAARSCRVLAVGVEAPARIRTPIDDSGGVLRSSLPWTRASAPRPRSPASAAAAFAVLADPAEHAAIDGTGWVSEALDPTPVTGAGQVFRMAMLHPKHRTGNYEIDNLSHRVRAGPGSSVRCDRTRRRRVDLALRPHTAGAGRDRGDAHLRLVGGRARSRASTSGSRRSLPDHLANSLEPPGSAGHRPDGPASSSCVKPASSRIGTPSCSALSALEPALSPTTT